MARMARMLPLLWLSIMLAASNASVHDGFTAQLNISSKSGLQAQKMALPSFEPEIPEHCRSRGICGDVPNYPQEYIDQLLQRNSTVSNAVNIFLGGYEKPAGCESNKDPNDIELCDARIELIPIRAGKDSNGRWRFLLGEHWVCVEICKNTGGSCMIRGVIHISDNYKATCIQKHIKKHTVGLNDRGVMMYFDINVSSACCCHIKQINAVGFPKTNQRIDSGLWNNVTIN